MDHATIHAGDIMQMLEGPHRECFGHRRSAIVHSRSHSVGPTEATTLLSAAAAELSHGSQPIRPGNSTDFTWPARVVLFGTHRSSKSRWRELTDAPVRTSSLDECGALPGAIPQPQVSSDTFPQIEWAMFLTAKQRQ
jgi:hypothetical protein